MFLFFLQLAQQVVTPELLATLFAGFVSPVLTQVTKRYFNVTSLTAYILHFGVSVALAVLALFLAGSLTLVNAGVASLAVLTLATTLFKVFKADSGIELGPKDSPPSV